MRMPPVIKGLDETLAKSDVPPEDREGLREEIKKAFANFDPNNPPGKPVEALPKGPTRCLGCGKLMKPAGRTVKLPGDMLVKFYDCERCDRCFLQPFSEHGSTFAALR